MRRLLLTLALAALVGAVGPAVAAPPTPTGADLCTEHVGWDRQDDGRLCKGFEKGGSALAHVCRQVLVEECSAFNGFVVSEAKVAAYEASWAHRALADQRHLDRHNPLRLALFPATHNSATSAAYFPSLTGLDDNQQYSILDQLRMDMRGLEIDVHWWPHPDGEPADGGFAPVLCHGTGEDVGCSNDRHLREGLQEIVDWLARPDAADEVLVVYLEDHLDGPNRSQVAVAHDRTSALVEQMLGDEVYRPSPPASGCATFPVELTRSAVRAAGKRIVLTTNKGDGCGREGWRRLVHNHADGAVWEEHQPDDFEGFPGCGTDFTAAEYEAKWNRYYEDSTWASHMASGERTRLSAPMVHDMVRCGVNFIGFDQLRPDDGRIEALVWSWAPGEPAAGNGGNSRDCAAHTGDARFVAERCSQSLPVACATAAGAWVIGPASQWRKASCPVGSVFAVPTRPAESQALQAAKDAAGVPAVWIRFSDRASEGEWSDA